MQYKHVAILYTLYASPALTNQIRAFETNCSIETRFSLPSDWSCVPPILSEHIAPLLSQGPKKKMRRRRGGTFFSIPLLGQLLYWEPLLLS